MQSDRTAQFISSARPYIELMRLDKPIGIYLLLWPTLWALWVAAEGVPDFSNLMIFVIGVVLMRSAGCVINDYADRKVDGHVKRTDARPLVTGSVTSRQALTLFAVLVLAAFILVLFTNKLTIMLSFGGLLLASVYPFMKRHTHLPQIVLGAAFSWAIPMAFAAQINELPPYLWLLYIANLSWTVAYDTMYAMVDRDDDIRIGVKSTAILFGDADRIMIGILHGISIFSLFLLGGEIDASAIYYVFLIIAALIMAALQYMIRNQDRIACFNAFRRSHWAGMAILAGIVLSYL